MSREGSKDWAYSVDTDSNKTEFLVKDLQPFTTYTFRKEHKASISSSCYRP
jgi:hypothetical protein